MKETSERDAARSEGKKGIRYTSLPCEIILGKNKVAIIFVNTVKTCRNSGDMAPLVHHIGTGWTCGITITIRPRLLWEMSSIFIELDTDSV